MAAGLIKREGTDTAPEISNSKKVRAFYNLGTFKSKKHYAIPCENQC